VEEQNASQPNVLTVTAMDKGQATMVIMAGTIYVAVNQSAMAIKAS
jgi:hypothetical protein